MPINQGYPTSKTAKLNVSPKSVHRNNPRKQKVTAAEFARLEAKIAKAGGARDPAAVAAAILRRKGKL